MTPTARKLFLSCFLLMVINPAATVTIRWQPNTEIDLMGYRVYYGNHSREYHTAVDVGNRTELALADLLRDVRYFFAVTAYDSAGNESAFSDEVTASIVDEENTSFTAASYNFPNPFTAGQESTHIRYFLPAADQVTITIYDVSNTLVRSLLDRVDKAPGEHAEDSWDGTNASGKPVASGVYYGRITTQSFTRILKIAVVP